VHSFGSDHTNNWAVIVSTSKYWFNYRHNSDALTFYHLVKEQGIPDSNIILMIPEDVACTTKNVIPGTVYNEPNKYKHNEEKLYNFSPFKMERFFAEDRKKNGQNGYKKSEFEKENNGYSGYDLNNLYDESSIEIDYKGDDVTVENFLRVLTGRHDPTTPRNKRLNSNHNSNLFIYISGHGGDQFLKFRDTEILTAQDLAYAIQELDVQSMFFGLLFFFLLILLIFVFVFISLSAPPHIAILSTFLIFTKPLSNTQKNTPQNPHSHSHPHPSLDRFNQAYLLVETCQASTLVETINTPNVITSASSIRGENSYSHGHDTTIGVSIVDKFTHYLHQLYISTDKFKDTTMGQLLNSFSFSQLHSTHHVRSELLEFDLTTGKKVNNVGDLRVLDFFGASLRSVDGGLNLGQFSAQNGPFLTDLTKIPAQNDTNLSLSLDNHNNKGQNGYNFDTIRKFNAYMRQSYQQRS
jgi:glycosylphosphatidylinositol transamidase (GPIT) subunit GPI8